MNETVNASARKSPVIDPRAPRARVNAVCIAEAGEALGAERLRQRACAELLRQAAIGTGRLAADDPQPVAGVMSEAASRAIEALLDDELRMSDPNDDACRRFFAGNPARFAAGECLRARHVLFAVTPGVDVVALRKRAEACLIDLRSAGADEADRFAQVAGEISNCPSGAHGGALGWLAQSDCAPEFARELFGKPEIGVLPRLVHSRFGLHVVEVLEREPGVTPTFEQVRSAVSQTLQRQQYATSLRQYLQLLAGQATIEGVDLDGSDSPLVQ